MNQMSPKIRLSQEKSDELRPKRIENNPLSPDAEERLARLAARDPHGMGRKARSILERMGYQGVEVIGRDVYLGLPRDVSQALATYVTGHSHDNGEAPLIYVAIPKRA